jgi:hypothetical protein
MNDRKKSAGVRALRAGIDHYGSLDRALPRITTHKTWTPRRRTRDGPGNGCSTFAGYHQSLMDASSGAAIKGYAVARTTGLRRHVGQMNSAAVSISN